MFLSDADLIAVEREYCSRSLASFAKQAWHVVEPNTPLKWGWAIDAICEHLEAVTRGEIRRLLINVPPGLAKSLLTAVFWPAWEWTKQPHLRIIGTAHKQDLAVRDSTKCRRLIQSDWFQKMWPVVLVGDQNAKTKFENDATGFREAMAFPSMTGSRGDRVILDDPHSVDDANSRVKIAADLLTFREALPSRINNEKSAIVIIMQRLAENDVSKCAIDLGYEHLCLPMRFEDGRSKWVVGSGDPRKEDEELLFPERFSLESVVELEGALGPHAAAGQLQQRPTRRGGSIIRGEHFGRYDVLPPLQYKKIFADTAQKTKEHNDYSVFQCWGRSAEGRIYLIDQIRGKWEAPELKSRAIDFWNKHNQPGTDNAPLRQLVVEDKSSGTGLIQEIRLGGGIPVAGVERVKDKYTRALDVSGYIASGLVLVPREAPFVSEFVAECESFTADDSHVNDDQIDPMVDAINDMLVGDRPSALLEYYRSI